MDLSSCCTLKQSVEGGVEVGCITVYYYINIVSDSSLLIMSEHQLWWGFFGHTDGLVIQYVNIYEKINIAILLVNLFMR